MALLISRRMSCLMIFLTTTSLLVCFVSVAFSSSVGVGLGEQSPYPSYETSVGEAQSQSQSKNWARTERLLALAPSPTVNDDDDDDDDNSNSNSDSNPSEQVEPSSLLLAPRRTYRKDPLNHSKRYTGGWNITNRHYWASVGYTAVPFFAIAAIWFIVFGLCLSLICLCYCCFPRKPYGYSRFAYALSLIFLICFTIAAIIGCVVLYIGQGRFHSSTINTLDYVVNQADATSDNLRNVSLYLSAAKQINIDQVSLPPNVQTDIDHIQTTVESSATTLSNKTRDNSKRIKHLIESVRVALIIVSAAMLLLTFLGFVFSILGMQLPVYILVITGWILVTGTFILCGIFLLLHNVTGDTCVAMNQWVQNPTAHTALDDILPCVDTATTQETLNQSKQVTSQLVDVINTVITNVSNINFAPNFVQLYYNQSGPLLPTLCNPFKPDLMYRACTPGEVDISNATEVWSGYVCETSGNGICVTVGRLNPSLYGEMGAAVNMSYGLYKLGAFLVELEDCSFVRETLVEVEGRYCGGLRGESERIYVGLVMVATAVMLSLVFWVIYGRERRHRAYAKEHLARGGEVDNNHIDDNTQK